MHDGTSDPTALIRAAGPPTSLHGKTDKKLASGVAGFARADGSNVAISSGGPCRRIILLLQRRPKKPPMLLHRCSRGEGEGCRSSSHIMVAAAPSLAASDSGG